MTPSSREHPEPGPGAAARPRITLLFGNTAEHNSRAMRMATTLVEAGCSVTIVARAAPGLPEREARHGYEILRVPGPAGPRWLPAPRLPEVVPGAGAGMPPGAGTPSGAGTPPGSRASIAPRTPGASPLRRVLREGPGRLLQALRYLLVARAWARAVERAVPPSDAWQADGLVMLPVALALRARHGGRVVYDSLEIHVESGRFARLPGPWKRLLARRERRWARSADAVITVSRAYADVIGPRLGVTPAIVMNCPPRPPEPTGGPPGESTTGDGRPRRFHGLLGLPAASPVVLYHGYLFPHRGIEVLMEAIAVVAGASLVVMGFGPRFDEYRARAASLPHAARIHVVPGVAPEDLMEWVASADVAAMPIEGNTLNHRLTTPNKLFEAMGAGVPVVASDLPGMASIIRETGAGVLCDPDDPADVARAIRAILEAPAEEREAYRRRGLAAARESYNWERQADAYLSVYRGLGVLPGGGRATP